MTNGRWALLAGLLLAPPSLRAQIPGESVFNSRASIRQEYLEHTYREVTKAIQDWTKAVGSGDPRRVKRLVSDELLFGPLGGGWLARGKEALDSLETYFPRVSAFGISSFDFDASGGMAYVYASVYYQVAEGTTRETITADATIVFVQRGDTWKIRSYIERPRPSATNP